MENNTLKVAQAIIKAKYGSDMDNFTCVQDQILAAYRHDDDLYTEKILEILDDRLANVLKQISIAGLPLHKNKDLFDQAVKLTYVIHQKGWLDLFEENFPEHKEVTESMLAFAIRSGKAIQYIAPEYNYV